jgi:hypothetical protein
LLGFAGATHFPEFNNCIKLMARCGAQTLSGRDCRQIVKEGSRCWQHSGPQCSVCLSCIGGQSQSRKLDCGHEFHVRCLERWKTSCRNHEPTCPMCRAPFDVPSYKCRLIIERTGDNRRSITEFLSQNVFSIMEGFGLDFGSLVPNNILTDIHFDIDPSEDLRAVLTELGLPHPSNLD